MVRCRRSMADAAARVVMQRSCPTGAKVGATGGAPSAPASSSTVAPVAVTSHARSTCTVAAIAGVLRDAWKQLQQPLDKATPNAHALLCAAVHAGSAQRLIHTGIEQQFCTVASCPSRNLHRQRQKNKGYKQKPVRLHHNLFSSAGMADEPVISLRASASLGQRSLRNLHRARGRVLQFVFRVWKLV